jgi:hypothetical protein
MATPRAPRKSTGGVDVQLDEFETDLKAALEIQLLMNTDMDHWHQMNCLSDNDNEAIRRVIDLCFLDLTHRYSPVPSVTAILEHCRILIQNVVWAAMNVSWTHHPETHIGNVIDNAITVYNMVIYAPLRTEMIMANHNCEVLQRTWRRCITDPSHPACRRRIEFEFNHFNDSLRDLKLL